MMRETFKALVVLALLVLGSAEGLARNVYLNGIDISSSRHQFLQNVNIRIDGNGNLFIEAPHYQVNEENTYTPLSQWRDDTSHPHLPPGELKAGVKVGDSQKVPEAKTAPVSEVKTNSVENPTPTPVTTGQEKPANANTEAKETPPAPAGDADVKAN